MWDVGCPINYQYPFIEEHIPIEKDFEKRCKTAK